MDTTTLAALGALGEQLSALAALAQVAKAAEGVTLAFASPTLGGMDPRRTVTLGFKSDSEARAFIAALEGLSPTPVQSTPADAARITPLR